MASGFLRSGQMEITQDTLLCPMIDARRMEVYMGLFNFNLEPIEPVQAKVLEPDFFAEYLHDKKIVFFGDGAFKVKNIYPEHPGVFFADFYNSAAHLTEVALRKFEQHDFEDVAYFEPFYLKDFVAGKAKS
jgi:tRNA threonylcarbamoyladenosine biosynthesis protein TsaB